jgi:hypothetical protein
MKTLTRCIAQRELALEYRGEMLFRRRFQTAAEMSGSSRIRNSARGAANSLAIEDQNHFYATALHLFTHGEGAAKIRKVERVLLVGNPMAVGRQVEARLDLPNQPVRWL